MKLDVVQESQHCGSTSRAFISRSTKIRKVHGARNQEPTPLSHLYFQTLSKAFIFPSVCGGQWSELVGHIIKNKLVKGYHQKELRERKVIWTR